MDAGWPDIALKGIFYQSLNETIKDYLCSQPETKSFEELVSAALRSDIRLGERQVERNRHERNTFPNSTLQSTAQEPSSPTFRDSVGKNPEEPMQIGHSKLTPEERRKGKDEGTCFYCDQPGHLIN